MIMEPQAYSKEYYSKNSVRIKKRTNEYYHKNKESIQKKRREHYLANKDRILAKNKEWKDSNKEKSAIADRASSIKRKYGLSLEQYDKMVESQGNRCALCFREYSEFDGNFHVDHNHRTGAVRGLLCPPCNKGLGMFNDNLGRVKNAVIYLEKYAE